MNDSTKTVMKKVTVQPCISTKKTTSSKAHLKIFLNTFIILWIHLLFYYEYKYLN